MSVHLSTHQSSSYTEECGFRPLVPWGLQPLSEVSFFLKDDVRDEQDEACCEEHDQELVDGEDILQSVDPLLHGTGVEVIVHRCPDAPHHPHYIHYQLHGSVFDPFTQTHNVAENCWCSSLSNEVCMCYKRISGLRPCHLKLKTSGGEQLLLYCVNKQERHIISSDINTL